MAAAARPQFRMICCAAVPNASGSILLVQEAKCAHRGQWNLPGGHAEHGELPMSAVVRELREETHLQCEVVGLLGIYCGETSIRFAFQMTAASHLPVAGDEILDARFFPVDEIARLADSQLVRPATIRQIIASMGRNEMTSLSVFQSTLLSPHRSVA